MLHHSLTKDSATVSWDAIRRYHKTEMKMKDIGYHFGVELAGNAYEALIGRSLDEHAAGCPQGDMNRIAVHICMVGNFDAAPPPKEQLIVLRDRLLTPLMLHLKIGPEAIVFHRYYASWKTCPGTMFTKELLAGYLPGGTT
jgi:hypothetical protein